jgi:hypothetical protein
VHLQSLPERTRVRLYPSLHPGFKCGSIVSRERNLLPQNKLYYEAQAAAKEVLARANWENPCVREAEVDRFAVDY